ncbi:hypothetical protein AKJ09_07492 [Labilithrix luteola]|uniref:Capsule synthesis protein CapA domain-containing protein n=1 Tax=Labilithrix luteola TaxID=1391654 RepID=A0A0K1Q537_9BACT|nr:CapA family protein [Labilithrix luteola]AKV00829.1 hypothetical protein AKJ09_07492 [Labilithrix luteola]
MSDRARALSSVALLLATMTLFAGCSSSESTDEDLGETSGSENAVVAITEPDETAPASALAPASLDASDASLKGLLDIRGVGDAAWSNTHEQVPLDAQYGAALDRFDRTRTAYRGDLSYINWETVVGNGCSQFSSVYTPGKSYAFVSRPENLGQLEERGFNLIGLSNNHTRDCYASTDTALRGEDASPDMTARSIEKLGDVGFLWAGVSSSADADDLDKARVRTFNIKGRNVRVAFGSLYMGRPKCPRATCSGDRRALFESLRDADADVRILALHSMAAADQDELVRAGVEFVKSYGGDVVFGSGPHVWKPVRVVRKNASFRGGTGVVFESLGNFLHPSLGAQTKNFIGRALYDLETKTLRQVQVLPVANAGRDVRWSSVNGGSLESNLRWTAAPHGVYANVKR